MGALQADGAITSEGGLARTHIVRVRDPRQT